MLSTSQSVKNDPRIKLVYPLISSSSITYQTIIWWSASAVCRWEYIWVSCRKLFETMFVWCDLVFICCQFISWKIRVKWNYLNQVSGLSKLYLNTFQMKLTGRWLAWLTCLVSGRSTSAQYQASSSPGFMDNINFDDFIHSSAPGTYSEGTRKVSYSDRGIMPAKFFLRKI